MSLHPYVGSELAIASPLLSSCFQVAPTDKPLPIEMLYFPVSLIFAGGSKGLATATKVRQLSWVSPKMFPQHVLPREALTALWACVFGFPSLATSCARLRHLRELVGPLNYTMTFG